jgi:hypothetical protein
MPQQLIYTSAQRGIVAGRSGHCTVARSAAMREALMLQLEKLSYYQHLSLSGGQERQIYSCRVLDIRGSRYHVLSRIQDAGLDFTGRTNFLAHHLVFTPEEVRQLPSPPIILRSWSGWVKAWNKEPQMLENEDWSGLTNIAGVLSVPATTWQQLTGDAVNGYGLLDSRSSMTFRVDSLVEDQILALLAESLELLELRDPRRDFRVTAWEYTFTTSMQEQDNPADFRWRCLHSDNPASNRFAGPDCRPLTEVRAQRVTNEEKIFAQSGRQPPRFVIQPQNVRVTEGEPARLHAKAEGVPSPSYQWYAVDQAGNGQIIANGTNAELVLPDPPFGLSRYVVRASNSQGEVTSEVAKLEFEKKLRISASQPDNVMRVVPKTTSPSYVRSADDIDKQRRRIESDQAQKVFEKKQRMKKVLAICGVIVGLAVFAVVILLKFPLKKNQGIMPVEAKATTNPVTSLAQEKTQASAGGEKIGAASSIKTNEPAVSDPSAPDHKLTLSDAFTSPPAPWKSIPIGSLLAKTSAVAEGGVFIVNGAGENIFGRSDNFFFLQQAVSNSVDFVARLQKADKQNMSRHGIMIRESEKPDAAFAFVGLSQTSVFWLHRDRSSTTCQLTNLPIPKLPVFLRLVRQANLVSGAISTDETNWTWLGTNQIALSSEHYLVGFAVSSGDTNRSEQAQFDKVKIAGGNP